MNSENKVSQKELRKPPLSSQEESLAEKVTKYPCLLTKVKIRTKKDAFPNFSSYKTFV